MVSVGISHDDLEGELPNHCHHLSVQPLVHNSALHEIGYEPGHLHFGDDHASNDMLGKISL